MPQPDPRQPRLERRDYGYPPVKSLPPGYVEPGAKAALRPIANYQSPLEQVLSADEPVGRDELRAAGMDELRKRMIMQMLLRDTVEEGRPDPTAPGYMGSPKGNAPRMSYPIGGIQPDRSGDPGMALKPSGGQHRMAPRDQGVSVGLISTLLDALKGR